MSNLHLFKLFPLDSNLVIELLKYYSVEHDIKKIPIRKSNILNLKCNILNHNSNQSLKQPLTSLKS